jgi:hypothetical protein
MAIIPENFQEKLDGVLQRTMSYKTLGATSQATVTKKTIDVLQDLNQPSSFDNYIDVMQQYIDLAHNILAEGVDKPRAKFAGEGWSAEIDRLYLHFQGFTNNIKKLASQWMGVDYKTKYDVDFLEPLQSLTVDTRISYWTQGYDTPSELVPFFEDLKQRLISMTEKDNVSSNQAEKAQKVWAVCKILQDRAMLILHKLVSMMENIVRSDKTVVSINLKEIIARANASPSATSGGRRKRSGHKRSGNKRSAHKKSGNKRSGHKSRRR